MRSLSLLLLLLLLLLLPLFLSPLSRAVPASGGLHRLLDGEHFVYSFGQQRVLLSEADLQEHDIVGMRMAHGQDFECYVPKVKEADPSASLGPPTDPSEEHREHSRSQDTPIEHTLMETNRLLDKYAGRCFLRKEGWWTYEYCHKNHVRQYHAEDQNIVLEFSLGLFDKEETERKAEEQMEEIRMEALADQAARDRSEGSAGFLEATEEGAGERAPPNPRQPASHMHTGGTPCDLNSQLRSTEVKFLCGPDAGVTNLMEPSTCHYQLDFSSPEMCQHESFAATRRARNVVCVPKELGHLATVSQMEARTFQRRSEPAPSQQQQQQQQQHAEESVRAA